MPAARKRRRARGGNLEGWPKQASPVGWREPREGTASPGASWAIFRQAFWAVRWIVAAAVASMFVVSGINAVQPLLYRLLFDTAVPEAD